MNWLRTLWAAFKRERNRRRRWAQRTCYTWKNDYREYTERWRESETRARQS